MPYRIDIPPPKPGQLAVYFAGEHGIQERILLLSPDALGIRVREWHPGNWATGPDTRLASPADIEALLDRAARERTRVTPPAAEVRAWLAALPK
jgi:hypothetical protein